MPLGGQFNKWMMAAFVKTSILYVSDLSRTSSNLAGLTFEVILQAMAHNDLLSSTLSRLEKA